MVKPNTFFNLLLVLILTASCIMSFHDLSKRSLLDWDEAAYLNIVKTWRAGAGWFAYKVFSPEKTKEIGFSDYLLEHGGAVNTFAKDGFLALLFSFSYLVGIRDTTTLWLSVVFGILSVWLTYLIGREIFGRRGGLLSCAALAVSVFHLHYSRSGFPQATAVFFLYLAFFLFLAGRRREQSDKINCRFLFFSGLSLGYAVSCHYSVVWSVPLFFLWETLAKPLYAKNFTLKYCARHFLFLSSGTLIPVLFWGGFSELIKFFLYHNMAAKSAIRGASGTGEYITFFQRMFEVVVPFLIKTPPQAGAVNVTMRPPDPLFYIRLLKNWEGPVMAALLAIGILYLTYRLLRQRNLCEFAVLSLFLAPFFYLSFNSRQLARSFYPAIPAMALIIGGLLSWAVEKASKNVTLRMAVVFFMLLFFAFQARSRIGVELNYASGYPAAIKFMRSHLGPKHLSSQFTISRFFVGRKNALDISVSFQNSDVRKKLKELYHKDGYRYLLLDQSRYLFKDSLLVQASSRSRPVLTIFHSTDANLYENNALGFIEYAKKAPRVIEVYNLDEIIRYIE